MTKMKVNLKQCRVQQPETHSEQPLMMIDYKKKYYKIKIFFYFKGNNSKCLLTKKNMVLSNNWY